MSAFYTCSSILQYLFADYLSYADRDRSIFTTGCRAECGAPSRMGTITMITADEKHRGMEGYPRCLAEPGSVEACAGTAGESWTVTPESALRSSDGECLAVANGKPVLEACRSVKSQRWRYTLKGNLISGGNHQCLSAAGPVMGPHALEMQRCGHNLPNQIWSLPN